MPVVFSTIHDDSNLCVSVTKGGSARESHCGRICSFDAPGRSQKIQRRIPFLKALPAMKKPVNKNEFAEVEAQRRFEAALKGALKTPHKPLKPVEASVKKASKKKEDK